MGLDDGEWIHVDGSAEDADEEWPDHEWPAGPPPAADASDRVRRGDWGIPGFSVRVAAVVAVLAVVAGVAAGVLVVRWLLTNGLPCCRGGVGVTGVQPGGGHHGRGQGWAGQWRVRPCGCW